MFWTPHTGGLPVESRGEEGEAPEGVWGDEVSQKLVVFFIIKIAFVV